jgi:uncharacterized protein YggE
MKLKKFLLSCALLLPLLALGSGTSHAKGGDSARVRTVTVSGTATTRTTPDTVVWSITTSTVHKNLVQAKEASDKQMQAILAAARKLGVKPEDLQTGLLDVSIGKSKPFRQA